MMIPARIGWFAALVGALTVVVIAVFVPLPYPTTVSDRATAITEGLRSLNTGSAVDTDLGSAPLPDRLELIQKQGRVYFLNAAGVPDDLFLTAGLKRLPEGYKLDLNGRDAIVSAGYANSFGHEWPYLQFSYMFASEGGRGFEVRIHKSAIRRKIVFIHKWRA